VRQVTYKTGPVFSGFPKSGYYFFCDFCAMSTSAPFEFVFETLEPLKPLVRPMFGCHALYVGEKMILIVRKKEKETSDNGVWFASPAEHRESMKKEFRSARPVGIIGGKGDWLNIPEEDDNFEEDVMRLCSLVLRHDKRIGKIPKSKKKKKDS
jgi:hypothetical protein